MHAYRLSNGHRLKRHEHELALEFQPGETILRLVVCHACVQDRAGAERSKIPPKLQGSKHLVERANPHEVAPFYEDDMVCKLQNLADRMADINYREKQHFM